MRLQLKRRLEQKVSELFKDKLLLSPRQAELLVFVGAGTYEPSQMDERQWLETHHRLYEIIPTGYYRQVEG